MYLCMAKILNEFRINKFNSGLNTADSSLTMPDSDLVIAENVEFIPTGGVKSINPPLSKTVDVYVNSIKATKALGGCVFNGKKYVVYSNGTNARWMYLDTCKGITAFADAGGGYVTATSISHGLETGHVITIVSTEYSGTYTITKLTVDTYKFIHAFTVNDTGTVSNGLFKESSSNNLDPDALVECQVYDGKLWFLNGTTTSISAANCVIGFIDTSNTMTGLTTAQCGLPTGLNSIQLHLQRIVVAGLNYLYLSKVKPAANAFDWDVTTAYTGADTAGYFIIDNNTEDFIQELKMKFGMLIVYRRFSVWLLQGATVSQMFITKQTNSYTGVRAKRSVAQAGIVDYFLGNEGVKTFNGQTVKEGTTNVDTISTDTLDRKIKSIVDLFTSQTTCVGYAFRDKYYLSDIASKILVFDEVTGGWSQFTSSGAELFLEQDGLLYFAKGFQFYQINADSSGSITSAIKTKDFNAGSDVFWKTFHKMIITLVSSANASTFILDWYLSGASQHSGSQSVSLISNLSTWDSGLTWDSRDVRWDTGIIDFAQKKINKLRSGMTISFGITATGTNRFNLDGLSVLFETIRREV